MHDGLAEKLPKGHCRKELPEEDFALDMIRRSIRQCSKDNVKVGVWAWHELEGEAVS
jgi:hypothetical protein